MKQSISNTSELTKLHHLSNFLGGRCPEFPYQARSCNPANNAEQVWFNFVPTLTEQLFRLCDRNSFKLSYENVHLFVTTLCQLFVSTLFQVVTEIGTKLEQKVGTK